jgi:hypothetical protein
MSVKGNLQLNMNWKPRGWGPGALHILTSISPVRKGKVVPIHAIKAQRGVEVQLHPFLTCVLDGGQ